MRFRVFVMATEIWKGDLVVEAADGDEARRKAKRMWASGDLDMRGVLDDLWDHRFEAEVREEGGTL